MIHQKSGVPLIVKQALRNARHKQVPAGQIIFYEDDIPQEVFMLKEGIVKVYDIDEQGNEKILHLVKSPAVMPFAFFAGMEHPLRWFYATLTDCEFAVLPASELQMMTRKDVMLYEALTRSFVSDLHELLVRLSSLSKTNARDKILAALHFLMSSHATERRAQWWRVNFPVSHQLIADLCGITRETAAITMKELQGAHVIRNTKVTVLEISEKALSSRISVDEGHM